ncbi:LEA type 2 family protein [Stenotrophomonas rhizophila]|uniref:NDR1/HIN1-like protein n=1 Tax=Stenotrophomonas rhizophila TaxID=216778 RepID=UPI001E43522E|nr:LEA type 2 family protein [Stenotrophomonas rhizophila]MCC7632933.1 LEA type 2 family protein [Stenotrophomonas rhizophila]MCC7662342.1 LEA type 2 family protein [Stenotrophomonas rhizophila]
MHHRFRTALIVALVAGSALALAACNTGVVKRVSPPAASVQQLTVRADGGWDVALRLQNFSSMPMRFDEVKLTLKVGDEDAGTLATQPALSIGGVSADVITLQLQPSSGARLLIADALASNRTLGYALKGTVSATPQEKKQRSFDIDSRSTLNQAPGLPGVLR